MLKNHFALRLVCVIEGGVYFKHVVLQGGLVNKPDRGHDGGEWFKNGEVYMT